MEKTVKKPVVLMILDGYGLSDDPEGNAIMAADTSAMDALMKEYPFVTGQASGLYVGLPDGQMGNSEVGHLNMGAGRIVYQDLTRISRSIKDGDLFEKKGLKAAADNCRNNNSALHIMGLLSDGGVHSDISHIKALIEFAKREGLEDVFVHCFMDGRDTSPTSGAGYAKELEKCMREHKTGRIATISGRYYAMDRDNRWERIEKAYAALVRGEGVYYTDAVSAIEDSYSREITDEFIVPAVITSDGEPVATIKENDSVIFANFRPDRARQITRTFCCDDFDGFDRGERIKTYYLCFTEYDVNIPDKHVLFGEEEIINSFGAYIASKGLKQARIAETEKYAHVTFFFNGGVEEPDKNEDRFLIPSPKVATYDLKPEMSADEVCDKLIETIMAKEHDVIVVNFANPDMVGHTGVMSAVIKAIEKVNECVARTVDAVKKTGGVMFLCADHGNAEELIDHKTKEPWTAHTTNPVPFILVNAPDDISLREDGRLCDIAPTMLELLDLPLPEEMTGSSLLIRGVSNG